MFIIIMRAYNYVHNKQYVTYSGFQLNVVKQEPNQSIWSITKDTENTAKQSILEVNSGS